MREAIQVAGRELPERVEAVEEGVDCELHTRGRYQICMELASGGMGTVYLALYRGVDGFERVVALKRMHPELARQKHFVEMFFDEAQALARVQHPNVCALLDLGTFDDSYFLAMDYLEGEPLSAVFNSLAHSPLLRSGERLPYVIARVFARLCDGLEAVHQTRDERGELMNLVHCDISPQNLFVLYDGSVRLMDFGAARARSGMLHQERPGMARGKLPYMAPEQLDGKDPDLRFDIWSMGVTMWELLTGQSLFDGRTMRSIIEEVKSARIPLVSAHNPRVPPKLASVVDRALMRDPAKRFGSARELSAALEQFLSEAGECVPAAEVSVWLEGLFGHRAQERHKLRSMARAIGDHLMPPSMRPFGELNSAAPEVGGAAAAAAAKTIELNLPAFTQTQAVDVNLDMMSMSLQVPLQQLEDAQQQAAVRSALPTVRRSRPFVTAAIGAGALLLLASAARMLLLDDQANGRSAELAASPHGSAAPGGAPTAAVPAAPSAPTTGPTPSPQPPAAPQVAVAPAAAPVPTSTPPQVATAPAPLPQPTAADVPPQVAAAPLPQPAAADMPPQVATAPAAAPVPEPTAANVPPQALVRQPTAAAPVKPVAEAPKAPAAPAVPTAKPAAPRVSQTKPAAPAPVSRPKPATTPAPSASSTFTAGGSVLILTKPGPAYIFFQGRQLGRSPTRVRLPVGDHKLQLKPVAGGPDVFVQVHMEDGWSSIAQVKLQ